MGSRQRQAPAQDTAQAQTPAQVQTPEQAPAEEGGGWLSGLMDTITGLFAPPAQPDPGASATTPYLDAADADTTFGADTSSAVGDTTTSYNHGTTLATIGQLTGENIPLDVFHDGERWRVSTRAEVGPLSNSTVVEGNEDGVTTTNRTEADLEAVTLHEEVAIGRSVTNDRWTSDADSLAYDMTRLLGTDAVDVVGMQDKWNLNAGFETTDSLPVSVSHEEGMFTGHDAYHFGAAQGENTDEARDGALAQDLANVDGVTDLSVDDVMAMAPGEGFAFVDQLGTTSDTSVTGRRQFGPISGSLTVGFGSGDRDLQQTMVAKTGDDEITISLQQADGDRSASQLGLGISTPEKGGLQSADLDATFGTEVEDVGSTEVEFKLDLSTEEGRREWEQFSTTGLLPGADDVQGDEQHAESLSRYRELSADLASATPGTPEYHALQAEIYGVSGELNNAFVQRDTFRESFADVDHAEYTRWRNENEQTVTQSASLFAWEMSRVSRVEREWDEYAIANGQLDYEAGLFQDTEYTEGDALVVSSPNSAPGISLGTSSRAELGAIEQMYRDGTLPPGLIPPDLAQAVFEDGLGDFDDGGAQITTALTDEHVALLAEHGGDVDELLAGVGREDIWEDARNRDMEDSIFGDIQDDIYKEGQSGRYSEEDLRAFYDDMGIEWERWDGTEPTKIREQFQDTTMEDFEAMSPLTREIFIETRVTDLAVNDRNPWEVMSLVHEVEDPEERAHLMREVFEKIEATNLQPDPNSETGYSYSNAGVLGGDSANTASFLLLSHMSDVAEGLDPQQAADLMSGVRVDLVDARAQDWANDRLLDPLKEGQSMDEVMSGFVDEHVNWSIEHEDWDQLSDNFQAAAMAGGPEMVEDLVHRLGEDQVVALLASTNEDDPRRMAIYAQAFQGTAYAQLVEDART